MVEVNRSSVPVLSSRLTFSVEQSTVSGVSPEFGPVSEVMIGGSKLDTGNTEDTRVHTHLLNFLYTCAGLFIPNDVQQMMKEVVKMQDFEHPHVMSLLKVCLD